MRSSHISLALLRWLRKHLVALLLTGGLVWALLAVNLVGEGPVPQQPPEGYTVEVEKITLRWNRGTREGPLELQVSLDDPSFEAPYLTKKVSGNSHRLSNLKGDTTYYWRLLQNGEASPAASFKVSKYNVRF